MLEKILVMVFENEAGKNLTIKIKDIIDDLDEAVLGEIMDTVIDNKIFTVDGYPVSKKVKCKLVSTETTPFEV